MLNLAGFRQRVSDYLAQLDRGESRFARRPEAVEPALFGAIDTAMIRTVMGEDLTETLSLEARQAWADFINSFQQLDGRYTGGPSHPYHSNGNAISALSALGMRHRYCTWELYSPFATPEKLVLWFESAIDWRHNQWVDSQRFRGGPHMYYFSPWATDTWQDTLFEWLDSNLDSVSGRWRKGSAAESLVMHVGGASHIWPIYEHTGHPFPYPERVIDSILLLARHEGNFAEIGSFLNMDALHGIKVMVDQCPAYRYADIHMLLGKHIRYSELHLDEFWENSLDVHQILAVCDAFGVLYQLGYCTDTMPWTDHFSNRLFYNSAAVLNCPSSVQRKSGAQ